MPPLEGAPVRMESAPGLRDRRGPVHAGSFLRERRIALDCTRAEFPRIFVHEVAHFIWLRLGNPLRLRYEEIVRAEIAAGARGELGWSAEWRKDDAGRDDDAAADPPVARILLREFLRYRRVAVLRLKRHEEFTLGERWRQKRRAWFTASLENRTLSI